MFSNTLTFILPEYFQMYFDILIKKLKLWFEAKPLHIMTLPPLCFTVGWGSEDLSCNTESLADASIKPDP